MSAKKVFVHQAWCAVRVERVYADQLRTNLAALKAENSALKAKLAELILKQVLSERENVGNDEEAAA